jgi:hypothetical protein
VVVSVGVTPGVPVGVGVDVGVLVNVGVGVGVCVGTLSKVTFNISDVVNPVVKSYEIFVGTVTVDDVCIRTSFL